MKFFARMVDRVFRAGQTGLYHGEAKVHEEDEKRREKATHTVSMPTAMDALRASSASRVTAAEAFSAANATVADAPITSASARIPDNFLISPPE